MTLHLILLIAALIAFVLAALPKVSIGYVNLTPLGLALLVASMLILGGCDSPRDEADHDVVAVDNSQAQTNVDDCPRADGQPCR